MFKGQDKSGRTSCARTPARNDAVSITLLIRKKGEKHTYLVDCPRRPGIEKKTFDLKTLGKIIRWINREKFDVIFFD